MFIHLPVDGYLDSFHYLTVMNNTVITLRERESSVRTEAVRDLKTQLLAGKMQEGATRQEM